MAYEQKTWFVYCHKDPDEDASYQPGLHPHIYHVCRTCGQHVNDDLTGHSIIRTIIKRQRGETINAMFERLYKNPKQYIKSDL